MKKQRLLALLMAAMMLLNMTACGKKEEEKPEEPETPPVVETPVKPEKPKEEKPKEEEKEPVLEVPELGKGIAEYKAKNSDVVGWLKIPDTTIDEAVVQGTNNDYYYRRDNLKNYNQYSTGCYWMDYECLTGAKAEDLGKSTVIYGHNVDYGGVVPNPYSDNVGTSAVDEPTGDKFSQLFHYTDIDWAKDHPYIYYSTPEEDLVWEVFSVAYTTTNFRYIDVLQKGTKQSITGEQMMKVVEEGRNRSEYDYNDVEVNKDDKILTLSTCTYKYGNNKNLRFIVMAKLVTEDDKVVETANITLNEDKIEVQ